MGREGNRNTRFSQTSYAAIVVTMNHKAIVQNNFQHCIEFLSEWCKGTLTPNPTPQPHASPQRARAQTSARALVLPCHSLRRWPVRPSLCVRV